MIILLAKAGGNHKMYRTSEQGIKEIRRNLIKNSSLSEIESIILNNPENSDFLFEILQEAYIKVVIARQEKQEKQIKPYEPGCF